MTTQRVGIVGCGKMAGAMLARWLETGTLQPDQVVACTASAASAAQVTATHGVACGTDAQAVVDAADVVLLAVKPQLRAGALAGLRPRQGQVWLSVLAGVTTQSLAALLPDVHVVRLMPNTPVRLGRGLIALTPATTCPSDVATRVRSLLAPLGTVVDVAESDVDAFTAVAGSGPAYVFLFIESLTAAGIAAGLSAAQSAVLAQETVLGAGLLAAADGRAPAVLRAEVTSKGGMTQAALEVLQARGWPDVLPDAVAAAVARAKELAK